MHELPVVYYNTKMLGSFQLSVIDSLNTVHKVRHYQENVSRIAPDEAKARFLLENAPVHTDAEKHVCADGYFRTMFLPPITTSIIQSMDLGVIESCKRFYHQKYMDEVLVVIEEEDDTRAQRTLRNIKTYNIKSAINNFASA